MADRFGTALREEPEGYTYSASVREPAEGGTERLVVAIAPRLGKPCNPAELARFVEAARAVVRCEPLLDCVELVCDDQRQAFIFTGYAQDGGTLWRRAQRAALPRSAGEE